MCGNLLVSYYTYRRFNAPSRVGMAVKFVRDNLSDVISPRSSYKG